MCFAVSRTSSLFGNAADDISTSHGIDRASFDRAQHTSEALRGADLERAALRGPGRTDADAGAWWTSMTVLIDDLHEVQEGIGADVSAHADALRADDTKDAAQ